MAIIAPTDIDALPAAPDPDDDQSVFDTAAFNWSGALAGWTTQANALADNVYNNAQEAAASATAAASSAGAASGSASTATTQAGIATTQAGLAAASATSAVNAPGTSGTSGTSTTVGAGTKTLTTQTGKAWVVGQQVTLARTSDAAATRMWGAISAYNSGTGSISIVVGAGDFTGTGTHTDWTIALSGAEGPAGADAVLTMPTLTVGASATLVAGNNGSRVVASATSTLTPDTAATLGDGWSVFIPAQTYAITITATFDDGASSKTVQAGGGAILVCNGTNFNLTPLGGTADARLLLHTGNGHGSTNTKVRRYSTTLTNTGAAAWTYADSASLGASVTLLQPGLYELHMCDTRGTGTGEYGVSVNSSGTTNLTSLTRANVLLFGTSKDGTAHPATRTVRLEVGDVVRPHTNGTVDSAADSFGCLFGITKVGA